MAVTTIEKFQTLVGTLQWRNKGVVPSTPLVLSVFFGSTSGHIIKTFIDTSITYNEGALMDIVGGAPAISSTVITSTVIHIKAISESGVGTPFALRVAMCTIVDPAGLIKPSIIESEGFVVGVNVAEYAARLTEVGSGWYDSMLQVNPITNPATFGTFTIVIG